MLFYSLTPGVLDEDVVPEHLAGVGGADLVDGAGAESVLVLVLQSSHPEIEVFLSRDIDRKNRSLT